MFHNSFTILCNKKYHSSSLFCSLLHTIIDYNYCLVEFRFLKFLKCVVICDLSVFLYAFMEN